jgi:thioredoxin-related protein
MIRILAPLFLVLISFSTLLAQSGGEEVKKITQLKIGDQAPLSDLVMQDANGHHTSLINAKRENGLVVIFSCNTCPYVLAWEDRYNKLAANSESNKVGFVVLNSNEAKRDGEDSFEAMKEKSKEMDYKFPYLMDENHVIADAFGATKTPDVFLFDKNMKLVYKGAIDDNQNMEEVEITYLPNAAMNMVRGSKIDPEVTKSIGCTIKRLNKVEVITQ